MRAAFPDDQSRVARLSLIDESGARYVRMAHLACVGSHAINGVAQLHSELLKQTVLCDFAELWPEKFCNVTNGVTPRRFVAVSNPGLTRLITKRIGDDWLRDLDRLRQLEPLAEDAEFQHQWREAKLANKRRLAALIAERTGVTAAPESLFDVQVKRIHEYKRQHLAVLHILTLYLRLRRDPQANVPARSFIFGGKAAPNFFLFGLTAAEVGEVKSRGYRARDHYEQNATLREVIDFIASGALSGGDAELFRPIVENLLDHDPFLLLADYQAYIEAQERVSALWRDPQAWTRQSVLNTARMGKFWSQTDSRRLSRECPGRVGTTGPTQLDPGRRVGLPGKGSSGLLAPDRSRTQIWIAVWPFRLLGTRIIGLLT